jgi:very-short-patch-repair endonuclease
LRGRQLAGLKWRRQVPVDVYFADFLCKEARLVVELDGEAHLGRDAYDRARTRAIQACGYQVIRFTNDEVAADLDDVLRRILAEVQAARGLAPSPSHSAAPSGPLPLPGRGEEFGGDNHV